MSDETETVRTRAGGQPRYLLLADRLIEDIQSGRYPVESLLPPEHELSRRFDLSRHTVREAMRRLADLGFVVRQAGVGTRVRAREAARHYVQTGHGISDLSAYVQDTTLVVRGHEDVVADAALAPLLECSEGRAWLLLTGERFLPGDPRPLARTSIYIAGAYRGILGRLDDTSVPIYVQIERQFGLRTVEVRQEIGACAIGLEDAQVLSVAPGAPGLRITRKYLSEAGELFEVAISLHMGERFSYASTLRLEKPPADL